MVIYVMQAWRLIGKGKKLHLCVLSDPDQETGYSECGISGYLKEVPPLSGYERCERCGSVSYDDPHRDYSYLQALRESKRFKIK